MTIYVLIDPRTGAIRYVGATHKPLEVRLRAHVQSIGRVANKAPRFEWLRELAAGGLSPLIEKVDVTEEEHWADAEQSWIDYLRGQGCNLLNVYVGGGGPRIGAKRNPWTLEQRERHSVAKRARIDGDPGYAERHRSATIAGMARFIQESGTEHGTKVSAALRVRYQDPRARERTSESSREMWARPGFKERHRERMREAIAKQEKVSCPVCGMTSRPGNIARHRKAREH